MMTKNELIEILNSKPFDANIDIVDEDLNPVEVLDFGFDKGLFAFNIVIDVPSCEYFYDDIMSDLDLFEIAQGDSYYGTCCDCGIGWQKEDYSECPLCKIKNNKQNEEEDENE